MSDTNKYISTININDTIYQIKDSEARAAIDDKISKTKNDNVEAVLNFVNGFELNGAKITASTNRVTFE